MSRTEEKENIEDLLLNKSFKNISTMFASLESAIESERDAFFVMDNEQPSVDFKQKVTKILGLENRDEYDDIQTLEKLGIKHLQLKEIKALVNTVYGINFPLEQLQELTIHSLLKIGEKSEMEVKTGLDVLFSYVDDDECRASNPFVNMATSRYINKSLSEKFDSTDSCLLMMPGFEGHHEVFKSMCNALKVQAMTFQTGLGIQEENIPKIAKLILKDIGKIFNAKSKFYLLGYSFGVNVALELASLMEEEGHTGMVFCLDSSPDALKIHMDEYIGKLNDGDLQNVIIEHMYCLFTGRNKEDVKSEISNLHKWTEKIEFCIHKMKSCINHSHEYVKYTIQGFYDKIKAARNYEPNYKLRSELVLLKESQNKNMSLAEDYGLSKYSIQPVRVIEIENDLVSTQRDYRIAGIINSVIKPAC